MDDTILVMNAGSSSLKFQLFRADGDGLRRLTRGAVDGIGVRPVFRATGAEGEVLVDRACSPVEAGDLPAATALVQDWLTRHGGLQVRAIGHRVVHGGPSFAAPVRIDAGVLARLEALTPLAPLHQPNNLAPIRLLAQAAPAIPQVACFDTAFHRDHPAVADCYALPASLHGDGVRRYGFHGLSYAYIAERLKRDWPALAQGKVVVAHLGSGASMCAIAGGRSMESTMGFTALDGLPMGTRPGQIDPGVLLYLMQDKGFDADRLAGLLYRESGLKGLSGISSDMRDLLASADPRAALAIDYFVHRCAMAIGSLAAAMDGIDALIFTAGIGENAPEIRARIAGRLGWLGARLDEAANQRGATDISANGAALRLLVIPTDEERMIASQTLALLRG